MAWNVIGTFIRIVCRASSEGVRLKRARGSNLAKEVHGLHPINSFRSYLTFIHRIFLSDSVDVHCNGGPPVAVPVLISWHSMWCSGLNVASIDSEAMISVQEYLMYAHPHTISASMLCISHLISFTHVRENWIRMIREKSTISSFT